jgi:hypothetical protein
MLNFRLNNSYANPKSNSSNFIFKFSLWKKYALLARLEAKVGKEDEVIFKSALLVLDEPDTVNWYGFQNGTIYLGILILLKLRKVEKHLEGKIAEALMANAGTLFSKIL